MFDLGWSEILVIAIVMIIVVGPKDLPRMLRSFGRTTAKMRAMAGDFRRQFDDALREAELDDVKNLVDDVRKLDPRNEIRKHLSPLEQAGRDIKRDLDKSTLAKPTPSPEPSTETRATPAEPLKAGATELPGETTPSKDAEAKTGGPAEVSNGDANATDAASSATKAAAPVPAAPKAATQRKPRTAASKTAAAKPATKTAAVRKPAAKKEAVTSADATAAAKPRVSRSKKNIGSDAQ